MKIRSIMTYDGELIASCEWTLDDRARTSTSQQALAAMSIEDHLRAQLKIEHKIVDEEDEEKESTEEETTDYIRHTHDESEDEDDTEDSPDSEDGQSFDSTVQDQEGEELNGVDDWTEID